jgi:hypothetical protein
MASKIVPLRLTNIELEMLDAVSKSSVRGDLSRSETLRLLIHREYNRRRNLPKPEAKD